MGLSKLEKAITVIEWTLKKRKRRVDDLSRKVQLTEREKIFIGEETEIQQNIKLLIDQYRADLNRNLGRVPPKSQELEERILGAVMLESGRGGRTYEEFQKIRKFLKPEHFYAEPHQLIWEAVCNLDDRNNSIDMMSVVTELRKTGKIELIGGAYYIAELTSKVSSCESQEFNARIIVEFAIKRALIKMASDVIGVGYDDETDCFKLLDEMTERFDDIKSWIK